MKKARTMLTIIVVIGIVGGALAFKVAKFNDPNLYTCRTTVQGGPSVCTTSWYNSITGLTVHIDPALLYTTTTTFHAGTAACTIGFGGWTFGCYDHPISVYLNP